MGFCDTCGLDYPASHTFCPLDGSTLHDKDDDFHVDDPGGHDRGYQDLDFA